MVFTVSPALPDDIPYLSNIQWAALLSNPLTQTLYPQGPTPSLVAFTKESYQRAIQFPSVRLIKATDEERGEIVAFAKWIIYPEEQGALIQRSEGTAQANASKRTSGWESVKRPDRPQGVDERALSAWNTVITKTRRRILRKKNHHCPLKDGCTLECYFSSISPALWVLDIIHTHPSYQGRGAASELLTWGTDIADKMHIVSYVESSPAGYPLFNKNGFEDITDMEIDLSRYRDGYGTYKYRHVVMVRCPETPPLVPPKDLTIRHVNSGFASLEESPLSNGINGRRISGKASLVEIKRSSRLDRSSSSKESNSTASPILDRSEPSRDSDTVTTLTGRFPVPTSSPRSETPEKDPKVERVWFSEPHLKPNIEPKEPTIERDWFSEHH